MMLEFLDIVRGTDFLSTLCKLLTAVLCGGVIGIEGHTNGGLPVFVHIS